MCERTPASTPNLDDATADASDIVHLAGPAFNAVTIYSSHALGRVHTALLVTLACLPFMMLVLGTSAWYHWVAFLVYGALLGLERRRFRLSHQRPPQALLCDEAGTWVVFHSGQRFAAESAGQMLVWPWLQVLPLKESDSGRPHTFIVLPDSASKEERRRLRLWMRLGRG